METNLFPRLAFVPPHFGLPTSVPRCKHNGCHGSIPEACQIRTEQLRPRLIVCHGDLMRVYHTHNETINREFDGALYFHTVPCFTRWLFMQDRGNIVPWCVLLTGWHEARLCTAAIAAAVSGEDGNLRADAKRPVLKEPVGECAAGEMSVAVGKVLILTSSRQQKEAACEWSSRATKITKLPIHIASSDKKTAACLRSLSRSMTIQVMRASF
mmetsp:Transcript_70955/g.154174  ORF Transcript_70955/g.154174 Transcript_70955/m.154174 type:complete len:212 (+) Transcript_70955:30-665(+)